MQYTINDLQNILTGKALQVYEIFQNFFGEGFTDIQDIPTEGEIKEALANLDIDEEVDIYELEDSSIEYLKGYFSSYKAKIYVWWPTVVIANENGCSTTLRDLYAKIEVTKDGLIPYENRGFQLTRSTYTNLQFNSGYVHSHIPPFTYRYSTPKFDNPCLGRGPINNTIMDLKNGYEEALWMLFCQELSLYVTVESLKGGPYIRMESIGAEHKLNEYGKFTNIRQFPSFGSETTLIQNLFRPFIEYYLRNGHLILSYHNDRYNVGMSYYDYIIDISNTFIDFFNKYGTKSLKEIINRRKIIVYSKISNGIFYDSSHSNADLYSSYRGTYLFDFKGNPVTLKIENLSEDEELPATILLNHYIAMYILGRILKVINYNYKNEYYHNIGGATQEGVPSVNKAIYYI